MDGPEAFHGVPGSQRRIQGQDRTAGAQGCAVHVGDLEMCRYFRIGVSDRPGSSVIAGSFVGCVVPERQRGSLTSFERVHGPGKRL